MEYRQHLFDALLLLWDNQQFVSVLYFLLIPC